MCGYDLRGLPAPLRCPECGHVAGQEADRQAALNWYRSARGLFFIAPPPAVMVHLHHPAAQRVAVRRFLLWVALPWAALCSLIVVLSSIVTVNTYERWWEPNTQPGQRRDVDRVTHERWLLGDPNDFGGVHTPNAKVGNKVYRSARVSTRLRLVEPRPATGLAEFMFAVLICIGTSLLSGYVIVLVGIAWARRTGGAGLSPRAALSAAAWIVPLNGVLVVCLTSLAFAGASGSGRIASDEAIACVFLLGGLAYLTWGGIVMFRAGRAMRIRRSESRVLVGFLMAAAWLVANGIAVLVVLGSPFLFRPRYS